MSLLSKLMDNARKAELGFGINENCVVTKVDNEPRTNKNGDPINRNSFTTISQIDESGKIIAEREVSWFNLDATKDYVFDNFISQLEQMTAIVDCYCPIAEGDKDVWGLAFSAILAEEEIEETKEELAEALKSQKTCDSLIEQLYAVYAELLEDKIGVEGPKLRVKLTFDNKGKNIGLPKFGNFVESMDVALEDSKLKLTKGDQENKAKSTETPVAKNPAKANL